MLRSMSWNTISDSQPPRRDAVPARRCHTAIMTFMSCLDAGITRVLQVSGLSLIKRVVIYRAHTFLALQGKKENHGENANNTGKHNPMPKTNATHKEYKP